MNSPYPRSSPAPVPASLKRARLLAAGSALSNVLAMASLAFLTYGGWLGLAPFIVFVAIAMFTASQSRKAGSRFGAPLFWLAILICVAFALLMTDPGAWFSPLNRG